MIQFRLDNVQLSVLDGGSLWLDGGAMFGIVPRTLWKKQREPDENNRIRLAMNLLLIDDGKRRTLVDTGAGDKWDEKLRSIYRIESRTPEEILEPVGLGREDIDCVINTHLHFDHAGGNTERDEQGRLSATYPNAEYVVQRRELETARRRNERIRASYLAENYEPLAEESGRLREVDGDVRFDDRVRLRPVPGHTPGMQMVQVSTDEGTVAFLADLVPTTSHLRLTYIMAYDLEPLTTLETKRRLLPEAVAGNWRVIFEHDDRMPVAMLSEARTGVEARAFEAEG